MLSFKTFLKEDTENYSTEILLIFEFNLHSKNDNLSRHLNSLKIYIIKDIIAATGPDTKCDIDIYSSWISITLSIPKNDLDAISYYYDNIEGVLKDYMDTKEFSYDTNSEACYVTFTNGIEILPYPIDYSLIYITAKTSNNSEFKLTNIEKIIGQCKHLEIMNCEMITSNVLSLLKIPKTCEITLGTLSNNAPWSKIVNNHLKGDRNILKCQRELIQNGFKEYAKF